MDDHLNHGMEPKLHIVIPESQDGPAAVLQGLVTLGIFGSLIGVTSAIELDHDHQLDTREVHDVRTDWMLSPELEAQHPAGA